MVDMAGGVFNKSDNFIIRSYSIFDYLLIVHQRRRCKNLETMCLASRYHGRLVAGAAF